MRFSTTRKIFVSTIGCLFLFSGIIKGQTYRFKNYGIESNLPSNVIYALNQDDDGYLWIGTTEGLSRFDGFQFFKIHFPDSATGRYPTASLKDKNGTLWFGCSDGSIFYSDRNRLKQVNLSNTFSISQLLEGPDGLIYAVPQRKSVFRINPSNPEDIQTFSFENDPVLFAASFNRSGKLIIGTQENLLVCELTDKLITATDVIEGFDYARIMSVKKIGNDDTFIIGTDGNGLFRLNIAQGNNLLSRFDGHPELEILSVRSILEDSDHNLWISTTESGVIRLLFTGNYESIERVQFLDKSSGLPGSNVSQVFQDSEGNFWIGFNGNGLSMLSSDAFSYYSPGENTNPNNIIYIKQLGGDYFLGTPSGFYLFDLATGRAKSFSDLSQQSGRNEVSSYLIDKENIIWFGTKGRGLFYIDRGGSVKQFYRSGDTGADYINSIKIDDKNIWTATLNGVNIIDRTNAVLTKSFNINNGLPHNSINQIYFSDDNNVYVATESDKLFRINADSGIFSSDAIMSGTTLNKIMAVTQGSDGIVWAATFGNGIFKCHEDSVTTITTSNGLFSNYSYSIFADSEDNIWTGHERGFSKYDPGSGLISIYSTDFAKGGACNGEAVYESTDGKLFIGTTEGLIVYDRAKDRKTRTAPLNNINSIIINNKEYPYQPSISLPYRKNYAIRIHYVGINFSEPDKVYYSTFLENYDIDWTDMSLSREVSYSMRDGNYRFNLISANADGLSQEAPVSFEILIKRPVWRSWWFILSLIGLISGIVVLIVREREKAQKKIQEYLEKELEARTRVVMKQKAEIELQNHEITDSINYARRIQASILPDMKRIKEHFSDAFILFQPRDIVSGDFYWFDKLDEDRFVLVCADSTGHGVPGAFMSLIGSTLLQDIVTRQRISRPSEILTILDKQIFSTLNQHLDIGVSNDGMDIVVCEFTQKNRHIRFASAMRPVIIMLGGEIYYIKGNRSSVGGESMIEKYYDDQEYYLNEGDMIYLFSDGFPDQFGGNDGKKMKVARLKKLINNVSELTLDQQHETILKFFRDWQGSYDQVDDVIFMGIRV